MFEPTEEQQRKITGAAVDPEVSVPQFQALLLKLGLLKQLLSEKQD